MTTIQKLDALASNMWWSWNPEVIDLFARLNPDLLGSAKGNPVMALKSANQTVLQDKGFAQQVDQAYQALQDYLSAPARYSDGPKTAYFCMEYGLHESFPIYSGGLGILAGDHCKAASDLGLPFTAIGLFLREGYFSQHFDENGWQQETNLTLDPSDHPAELVTDDEGEPVQVTVHLGHQLLHLRAWHVAVGRTTMYLLDSDFDANPTELRKLTYRLYQGDNRTRLRQEIILGIGGVRLLRALGVEADVYHMNEGHCAFLTFELLRERQEAGDDAEAAEAWVRERSVFTTHTPVMAGHDRFEPVMFSEQMEGIREQLGFTGYDLLAYGRVTPEDATEFFTMTVLGLKLSRQANGVSELNGEVARRQWQHMYRTDRSADVPIGFITNGIHLPTWASPIARRFLDAQLGDWMQNRMDPAFWERVRDISDEELWAYRNELRRALVDFAARYLPAQSFPQTPRLDPDALTIGFARRFATYKRATLLFANEERMVKLLSQSQRPLQIIYSGKAHPADEGGKRFIQQVLRISQYPEIKGKLVLLEDYNMRIGRMLVSGADVWLNNPRRPMEASGTSGQKVGLHGGLNLSILDGWWPEGYNGKNGWSIGQDASADYMDPEEQDQQDSEFLYETLEKSVLAEFYDRDAKGIPTKWVARMRDAMATLPYQFSAERMVADYIEQIYQTEVRA